jgi:hypothetical protein
MPIPEDATQPRISPRAVILHTAVDAPGPTSLHDYFARGDVTAESHFFVCLDGAIEQYLDTQVRADANKIANQFAVSIETEDDGRPDQLPWSVDQIEALVALVDWCCRTHGIPRQRIGSPTGEGIGWHSMWNASDGSSPWSVYRGKTCPGAARVPQVGQIIARVATGALPITHDEEDDDMPDKGTFFEWLDEYFQTTRGDETTSAIAAKVFYAVTGQATAESQSWAPHEWFDEFTSRVAAKILYAESGRAKAQGQTWAQDDLNLGNLKALLEAGG